MPGSAAHNDQPAIDKATLVIAVKPNNIATIHEGFLSAPGGWLWIRGGRQARAGPGGDATQR